MEVGRDGTICGHQSFPGAETWRSSGYVLEEKMLLGGLRGRKLDLEDQAKRRSRGYC